MMKEWLERNEKGGGAPLMSSAVLSTVVHTVLIGAAVATTASNRVEDRVLEETHLAARFLIPPDRSVGQQPAPEMIRYVAIAIPLIVGAPAVRPPEQIKQLGQIRPLEEVLAGTDERDARAMPELGGADSVFLLVEVDSAARRYEWSAAPAFPPRMLEQKMEGFVRAEWIVQTDGYADTATLRILESTHDDFAKAVRDALPFMRFSPAKLGRRTVSQLVQQEFTFRITMAQSDTLAKRRPRS